MHTEEAPEGRQSGRAVDPLAETYASIATSIPTGLVATDRRHVIVWVNPVAAAMLAWDPDQLVGQPLTVLFVPQAHDEVRRIHQEVLDGQPASPVVTVGLRRDGATLDLAVTPGPRRDPAGRTLGATITLRDVTEELRTQRELTEAVARSRARFEQSAKPHALLDVQGRFVDVNDAACALLGWSAEELVGRLSAELIQPTDPEQVRLQLDQLRDGALREASFEATGRRSDGTEVPMMIDIAAVRDGEGHACEFAVFARDLTDLREAERRLVSQESFFRSLDRESSDATFIADHEGQLVYVTPSTTQLLGYAYQDLVYVGCTDLMHPDDLAVVGPQLQRLGDVAGARERFTARLRDAEGAWRWFAITATNHVRDPDIAGLVLNLREVTLEVEAEQALRESEARYRAIAETAQEGILAVSPDGEVLFANERLTEILGKPVEQLAAPGHERFFAPAREARRLASTPAARGPDHYDVAYRHPNGSLRMLSVAASDLTTAEGAVLGILAMISDVTEQRASEARLRQQALHDPLTGLPNRLLFFDRLSTAEARRQRTGSRGVSLLFMDVDDFKTVNDTYGHDIGDELLVQVASRVAEAVRGTDTVARLGGDEFAVICEDADAETARQVASRIHKGLEQPVRAGGRSFRISMSIGLAVSPPHAVSDLLRLADIAMYRAKDSARGRVEVYGSGGD